MKPPMRQGMPPKTFEGANTPDAMASAPLPFSDTAPIGQDDMKSMMDKGPEGMPGGMPGGENTPKSGFDATGEQAPEYWPQELAMLWPNLPPDTRTSIDESINSGGETSEVEGMLDEAEEYA